MPFLKLSFWFNRFFEIVRCTFCGSRGTHRKCSFLKLYETNWSCDDCKTAVEGTGELNQTITVLLCFKDLSINVLSFPPHTRVIGDSNDICFSFMVFNNLKKGCPILSGKSCRFSFQSSQGHTLFHLSNQLIRLNFQLKAFSRLRHGFCLVRMKNCTHHRPFLDKIEHTDLKLCQHPT